MLTVDDGARSDTDDDAYDVQASAITRSKAPEKRQRADHRKEPTNWSVRIERPIFPWKYRFAFTWRRREHDISSKCT
jgi:hypothetical protein